MNEKFLYVFFSYLLICDSAKVAAVANAARGGGLESGEGYNIKISFLSIDNIHGMRHSLFKVPHPFFPPSLSLSLSLSRQRKH